MTKMKKLEDFPVADYSHDELLVMMFETAHQISNKGPWGFFSPTTKETWQGIVDKISDSVIETDVDLHIAIINKVKEFKSFDEFKDFIER